MARPPRVSYPGAVHHVMSRGNNRQAIMKDVQDESRYLEILEESVEIYGVILYAYVLMKNHIHLLIKTPHANLSDFMRRLHQTYTNYFNRKHRKCGHLFQGRFKSLLVQEERYLQGLSNYIHLNPVRVRSMKRRSVSEKIAHLRAYPRSSLAGYRVRKEQQSFIRYDLLLEPYGGNTPGGRRKHWNALCKIVREGAEANLPGKVYGGFVLGSIEFAMEILDRIRKEATVDPVPLHALHSEVTEENLWKRLEKVTGKSRNDVVADRGILRDVVMECLCRHAGMRGAEVARMFGLHESTVSKYRKRVRKRITEDSKIKRLVEDLTQ